MSVLDDPGFRFLLQLTASGIGQIWTSTRTQWDRLGHPDPGRLGITAGPAGQTSWLDTPQHPIATTGQLLRD